MLTAVLVGIPAQAAVDDTLKAPKIPTIRENAWCIVVNLKILIY